MNRLPGKASAVAEGGPSRKHPASPAATLGVEVLRRDAAWAKAGIGDTMLERAARAGFEAVPPRRQGDYQAAIVLAGDEEMRALNRNWRGKDSSTNVLSFPAGGDIGEPGFLGDIVLAYETVAREAREQEKPLKDHVAHLVVHGLLHLIGFDHADDAEAEEMESLERAALARLGIADPYVEPEEQRAAEASS
jgi:probable rRNA maturation factor